MPTSECYYLTSNDFTTLFFDAGRTDICLEWTTWSSFSKTFFSASRNKSWQLPKNLPPIALRVLTSPWVRELDGKCYVGKTRVRRLTTAKLFLAIARRGRSRSMLANAYEEARKTFRSSLSCHFSQDVDWRNPRVVSCRKIPPTDVRSATEPSLLLFHS